VGASFLSSIGTVQAQLNSGLLAYWDFDNNVDDQAVTIPGASGTSADNGTINGNVLYEASQSAGFGQAASFDGVAGTYVSVPDPSVGLNDIDRTGADMSFSIWIKATSWTKQWQVIMAHGEGTDYRLARRRDNSPVLFAGVAGTRDLQTVTTYGDAPAGDAAWHHIVVTAVNGGNSILYVDGVQEATSADLADPIVAIASNGDDALHQLLIGGNPEADGREYHGLIDELAIWDRALTLAEVEEIYTQGLNGAPLVSLVDLTDDDFDGLPNAWETLHGLDPADNTGDNGAAGDPDMDMISNLDEFNNGTSPVLIDSDGDGLNDNEEPNSDPTLEDTDGDGLSDGQEVNDVGTNPSVVDTDSDTIPDGYEFENGLNPLSDDSLLDLDGDLVGNLQEFTDGTDPQDTDTDDDFSSDGEEATNGTDPLDPDSDNDTLLDGHETRTDNFVSATDTGTNPLVPDSDMDGFDDNVEVTLGSDPNDSASFPAAVSLPIVDDFEDGVLDVALWRTINGTVSQNASATVLGGNVTEANGDLKFEDRGYLITSAEFDPEVVGGLQITGELSFLTTQDIVSVITRSDASPVDRFGEVNSGVQFMFSAIGDSIDIVARNGDHVVGDAVVDGSIDFQVNVPYTFTVIDDGQGNLSVTVTDIANPVNTISASATLTADTSDSNSVVIYNRENGRESCLHEIAIQVLPSAVTEIVIQSITYDSSADTFTVAWNSAAGVSYSLFGSTDLIDFTTPVVENIVGQAGTTSATFANPGFDKYFFRVGLPVAP